MPGGFGANVVESPQRATLLLALSKTGGATPALSGLCAKFCSVTKNGTGDYTIVVNKQQPMFQNLIISALPYTSGVITKVVASSNNLQVRVKCFAVDGTTPAELDFDMLVMGSVARDLLG